MQTDQPPRPTLPLLALLALASALGVAVAVALAGIAMLLAAPAYAGEGSLLLQRPAAVAAAPLLFAETESQEHGPIVRTRVVEAFRNPFHERLAGVYLHRLPENAVLERLTLTVLAQDAGAAPAAPAVRHAVLTLSEPATLAGQTAELGPGETLLVELEYQQALRYDRARTGSRLVSGWLFDCSRSRTCCAVSPIYLRATAKIASGR